MTLRESIVRQKRMAGIVMYAGLAWFAAAMGLSGVQPPWVFVAVPGIFVFFAGTVYLGFFLRCPRYRGAIGYAVTYASSPFSISRKIRFCPFCGVALDSEMERAVWSNNGFQRPAMGRRRPLTGFAAAAEANR